MSFISQEEFQMRDRLNLAPMIDFLFVILMFFASLAVSRVATRDSEIDLVKIQTESSTSATQAQTENKTILVNISENGSYKWLTDMRDYEMSTPQQVSNELKTQYLQGLLPADKSKTHVLLRIDRNAPWEPIMKIIFAIREEGFDVHPVYETEEHTKHVSLSSANKTKE